MLKGKRTIKPCVVLNCIHPRQVYYHNGKMKGYLKCCVEHFNWHRKPGPNHPNATKKGRRYTDDGYVQILDPRKCGAMHGSRYILEHRWIMEKSIGRPLIKSEVVHHMNGIRDDNRIDNLCLLAPGEKHESRTYIKALQKRILELERLIA